MKIEEQVLSREQMARLAELGVDTSDASMCWLVFPDDKEDMASVFYPDIMLGYATCEIYPTYTIGDLIEKLPKCIDGNELFVEHGWKYGYRHIYERLYVIDYSHIERLYELFCWVAETHKELIK